MYYRTQAMANREFLYAPFRSEGEHSLTFEDVNDFTDALERSHDHPRVRDCGGQRSRP